MIESLVVLEASDIGFLAVLGLLASFGLGYALGWYSGRHKVVHCEKCGKPRAVPY